MKKYILKSLVVGISCFLCPNIFSQTITLVSDNATLNQIVCVNTPIIEIKYDLSNDITSVTVEGLPSGVTHDFNATYHTLTINGTPTDIGNTSFNITTSGGAYSLYANGIINVEELNLPTTFDGFSCSNENITFEYPSNPAYTYTWSHNGSGNLINYNSGSNPEYAPSKNDEGTTVKFTVSLTNSCGTDSKDFNYSILKTPSFTGNLTTNPNATVQLIGSESTGYTWTSSILDTATISNTGLVTGVGIGKTTITYELTHLVNNGTTSTTCQFSQILSVVQLITPTITGNLTICSGSSSQLVGSENPKAENPWVSSNTSIATVSSTGLVLGLSQGSVVITYTNSTGGSASANVSINTTPTVSINTPTICSGSSATLVATPSITGGTYLWGGNETTQNIIVTPSTNTNYSVTYSYNSCTSSTANTVVTVNPIPTVSAGADITVCSGSTITLTGSGADTYSWSNSITNGVSFTPVLGSTSYELTGTSNFCSATDVVVVTVNEKPNLMINNPAPVCEPATIDITTSAITSGSTGNGILTYWTDANCLNSLGSPNSIINSGPIFIKSTLGQCFDIKPITVSINKYPIITNPGNQTICDSLELTTISGINLSGNEKYYNNSQANYGVQISSPIKSNQIVWIYDESGSCSDEESFEITIIKTPKLTSPGNQTVCDSYTLPTITGINLTGNQKYYNKSQAENGIQITGPITTSQIIWMYDSIKACANERDFEVIITPSPVLKITNPASVDYPATIDITLAGVTQGSSGNGTLTYWINPESSVELVNPTEISMSGTYFIKSTDGNCSDTNFVTVTINKKDIPTKLLSAYVLPTGVSNNGFCDGKAEVVITSGTAPYTYLFSDNSTTSSTLNLCPGLKSVRVTDANNDTLNLEFIISSPDNVTSTDNLKDSTIVNKLVNKVVSNCIIDYTKIESAKINKYKILSKDSIEIEWKIYSGLSVIYVTNKYSTHVISTSGVYQFTLQIYCPNKTMGNFLTAYDQMYINIEEIDISSGLGIQEKSTNEQLIYPNPFNDYITIILDNQKVSEISITENTGKIIKSFTTKESEVTIKTDDLLPGFYILKIKNGNSIKSIKLSK